MASIKEKLSFICRVFGPGVLGNDGLNIAVSCPKCSDGRSNKKKLVIKLDTDQHQCWVCDLKGSNLSYTIKKYYPESLDEYQRRFSTRKIDKNDIQEETVETVTAPKGFLLLAMNLSSKDPDVAETIRYARSRGLTNRDFWHFRLGTCKTGRYRRRLIIPSFNENGELNYIVGRSIDDDTKMKYLNAKVPKKNVVFNEINIDWKKELTIVEGPMDLTKCDDNATCLLGSHFSEEYSLFQNIVKNSTPVVLALDPDMAEKTQKYAKSLASYGVQVRVMDIGDFDDVGEMSKDQFFEAKVYAKKWSTEDRLYHLIHSIGSGSII